VEKRNQANASWPCYSCTPPQVPILWGDTTKSSIQFLHDEEVCASGETLVRSVDLERQIFLHLARFPLQGGIIPEQIRIEVRRITARLAERRRQAPAEVRGGHLPGVDFHRTHLDLVDSDLAQAVHRAFHYLGSPRREGIHLGLYAECLGRRRHGLVSAVTLSPFDLWHIKDALPFAIRPEEVLVLSRLFAFASAPHNTVSFTLGRVFAWLKTRTPHIKALVSYLNPNLGFRGTVYKATNWKVLGEEAKSRYLYIGGNYVTDRYAIHTYGTADPVKLSGILGSVFSTSVQPLHPLRLFIYFLDPSLRTTAPLTFGHHFLPDPDLVGKVRM
jgi:hypothetical protein